MAARRAAGWVPSPLHSFVLKVHSRCDLACDYCYMYRSHDQSWRTQPRTMTPATLTRTAERIAEHLSAHGTTEAGVVLHGGEPLLIGDEALTRTVRTLRTTVGDEVRLHVTLQTNGLRLTEQRLDLLGELGVRIGISTDGTRAAHDRHRRSADGRGSHARVETALRRLSSERHRPLFGALLCTIDLRNDPIRTYEALLTHNPPTIDFLLPLGNWRTPPPGLDLTGRRTPYADWLWAVFERWYGARTKETSVRLLDNLLALLLGATPQTEALGLSPVRYAVVDTDGSLTQDDTLRTAYDGAAHTGMDIHHHSFDTLLLHPGIAARQWGTAALSATCRTCPLHQVCGAGHYATRYAHDTGFANPSVYCADLTELIERVRGRVQGDLKAGAQGGAPQRGADLGAGAPRRGAGNCATSHNEPAPANAQNPLPPKASPPHANASTSTGPT